MNNRLFEWDPGAGALGVVVGCAIGMAYRILLEVGGFSDEEIGMIKEVIEVGYLNEREVNLMQERVLTKKQLIASLMGDADSYEFERFREENCFCSSIV